MAVKKKAGIKPKVVDDDAWITTHFEKLVNKYAGRHIIVCAGKVFTGENALKEAKKKYPNIIPTSMPIPTPEDFVSILLCKTL